jgi:hypothetical protein
MNPPRFAPRNVRREVDQLSATGFERYIADRFSDLGWVASEQPHRNSFDVEAISPTGKRYLLEVKYKEQNDNPTPLDAVRQILPAKLSLAPDLAIVVTSSPKGFTRDAQNLAMQHGIRLWTLGEVQVLADAAASGDMSNLDAIGLESPPVQPVQAPRIPVKPRLSIPRLDGVLWVLGIVALGFLVWLFLPKSSTPISQVQVMPAPQTSPGSNGTSPSVTNPTLPPLQATAPLGSAELEDEVRTLLQNWNTTYQTALENNDVSSLLGYVAGTERLSLEDRFAARAKRGCVLRIEERSPSEQGSVTMLSQTRASTFILRNAKYVECCPNQNDKTLRDGTVVKVSYDLEKVGGTWVIVGSDTTGGEIKLVAPAKPKTPELSELSCNGEAFVIAGREQACQVVLTYIPLEGKWLMSATAEVWIDLYDGGIQNKFLAHTAAWQKEDGSLQTSQIERGVWAMDLPFQMGVRENSSNFEQFKMRVKVTLQYSDNSAFRGEHALEVK